MDRDCTACGAVRADELDRIDRAATRRGLTRSEFVRSACLVAASLQERSEAGRRIRGILADSRVAGPPGTETPETLES